MNLVSKEDYENYLAHEGVHGMRWGVTHGPPYPLDRTNSGGISKKQERAAARLQRKEDREAARTKKRADKKAVRTLKKQKNVDPDKMSDEEKESLKKEVSKSKSVSLMIKYSDLFTTQEISDMANRLQAEQRLKDVQKSQFQKGMDFIKRQSTNLNTVVTAYDNIKKADTMIREINDWTKKKKTEPSTGG